MEKEEPDAYEQDFGISHDIDQRLESLQKDHRQQLFFLYQAVGGIVLTILLLAWNKEAGTILGILVLINALAIMIKMMPWMKVR